jgi:hypothetical protein
MFMLEAHHASLSCVLVSDCKARTHEAQKTTLLVFNVRCGLKAEYWQSSWTLLVTAADLVRITRLTDLSSGLESVCMSPASLEELMAPLPDDTRHLVVHCLLAASALLAQVCCATPPRQPFTCFTVWVEYARMLETLPSPVDLNIPSASALLLLLHWLKTTSPFTKFLQVRHQNSSTFPDFLALFWLQFVAPYLVTLIACACTAIWYLARAL